MTHVRTVGLALAVTFALTAGLTAAAASAALPEFGAPGGFPVKFKGSSGATKLEEIHVHCSSSTSEGEITSAKLAKKLVIKLKGCKIEPFPGLKFPCQSAGAAAEEIVTNALAGKAVYIKEATPKEAGIDIEGEGGGSMARAECVLSVSPKKTEIVILRGSVISKVPAKNSKSEEQWNKSRTTLELTFAQEKGKQIPEVYEEEGFKTTDVPSCEIKLEEAESKPGCGLELVETLEAVTNIEFKA